jgi:hypothetical protein
MTVVGSDPLNHPIEAATPIEVSSRPVRPVEPRLISMLVAALVLLAAVGVVLWIAASTPNGRSVVVTIRAS